MPRLSVIIPVFDESATVAAVVRAVCAAQPAAEVIVVDDGSADDSAAQVAALRDALPQVKLVRHPRNRGKGAAIHSGLAAATGELVVVQDADLEYAPAEIERLLAPFATARVQAVYGSRNLQPNPRSSQTFYWGGRALSWVANRLYGSRLTDITTGYKVVRTDLMRRLKLRCPGFEFCPELTAKLLRAKISIVELPISYRPRSRSEGKKIRARDGWHALATLVRLRCGGD